MIFQALMYLYERLHASGRVPDPGFSEEDIGFVVVLDREGNMVGEPEDLRHKIKANAYQYFPSVVPYTNQVNVRSSAAAKTPNFMVDKADYVFGMSGSSKKPEHHAEFKKLIRTVCGDSQDPGVLAVRAFLDQWDPAKSPELELWDEMSGPNGKWVAFRIQDERSFVHERPEVKRLWTEYLANREFPRGVNLLDGQVHDLQTQYAQFKFGSGASLVSFNKSAFESYGKKRGQNAPISVDGEFRSSTALKYLLRSERQRLRIGDATTVFWTARESPAEGFLGAILDPAREDAADAVPVREFLEATRKGTMPVDIDGGVPFYILGLSLNKARLALRFWHVCSVEELMERLHDHFANLEMDYRGDRDPEFPGIWHLLRETTRDGKDVPPLLGGALTRAILTGTPYPAQLYQAVLHRIRADQARVNPATGKPIPNVNHMRAAILKAVLQRDPNYKEDVPVSLDPEKRDDSYLLGRLFAVLEKAQLDALGKVNATIKDRFFSAASATPGSVFPRLLRLSQHHIEKAKRNPETRGLAHLAEKRIAEIMEHLDNGFPAHLGLKEQGLFAIAYYQQKNDLWRSKKSQETEQGENQ